MTANDYKPFSQAQVGDVYSRPLLIKDISEIVNKDSGKTHLLFTLLDGESEEKAMLFSTTEAQAQSRGLTKYVVAEVKLKVTDYKGRSFNIEDIRPLTDSDIKMEDFLPGPPISCEVMFDEMTALLDSVADDMGGSVTPISQLAKTLLEENKKAFMRSSAAASVHHNFLGGLIYHSYRMAKAADVLCGVYGELDKELLVSAAAIHDIGKIWEYRTDKIGNADYTVPGVLFGHIHMGASLINKQAEKRRLSGELPYSDEKVKLLTHMILSHHGTLEWGAVVPPAIPEAFALHYIDNLDAKLNVCDKAYRKMEGGTVTQAKPFTLDGRLYKGDSEYNA